MLDRTQIKEKTIELLKYPQGDRRAAQFLREAVERNEAHPLDAMYGFSDAMKEVFFAEQAVDCLSVEDK